MEPTEIGKSVWLQGPATPVGLLLRRITFICNKFSSFWLNE